MSQLCTKLWMHVILSIKNNNAFISSSVEKKLHDQLHNELLACGCVVLIINGMPDHIHLLFEQNHKMSVEEIIKQVKTNSSRWMNEKNLISRKFTWEKGYAAYSVSESEIQKVFHTIFMQKFRHGNQTFKDEYEELSMAHGLGRR